MASLYGARSMDGREGGMQPEEAARAAWGPQGAGAASSDLHIFTRLNQSRLRVASVVCCHFYSWFWCFFVFVFSVFLHYQIGIGLS